MMNGAIVAMPIFQGQENGPSQWLEERQAIAPILATTDVMAKGGECTGAGCTATGLRIFSRARRVGYLEFLELTGFVGWWVGVGELWI